VNDHRVFDSARPARAIHVRANANRLRKIGHPQSKIDEWITVLEESSAARFRSSETPAGAAARELVLTRPHSDQPTELATLKKAIELLDIAAESMVVADDHLPSRRFCGGEDALDSS
jgi:hypothetical protein